MVDLTPFRFPLTRGPTIRLAAVGQCIYCGHGNEKTKLTDEHIIPDGLGGDLVLPTSSCDSCSAATSRAETHLQREVLKFVRGVANVRSRKRKSPKPTATVEIEGADGPVEMELDDRTPFFWPMFLTPNPPNLLTGNPQGNFGKMRLGLFGDRDFNERGKDWLGGNGTFRWANRLHPGIVGQALAKMAHSYAVATVGLDGFQPFLPGYILAREPLFDKTHIAVLDSNACQDDLHYIDLQLADAPLPGFKGSRPALVAYLRLFAYKPSPSILITVGWPTDKMSLNLKKMSLN